MTSANRTFRFVHVFSGFGRGGLELRTASIINRLRSGTRHWIVALNGNFDASSRIGGDVEVEYVKPPEGGTRILSLRRLLSSLRPDLLLTYNWGAMDAVFSHFFAPLCPLVHHEGGLGAGEANHRMLRRRVARAVLLRRAFRTIVVSSAMHRIAREEYRIPPDRLRFIRSGVDTARFTPGSNSEIRESIGAGDDTVVFGFAGRLSDEKNLSMLLRAFHAADLAGARLMIVGEGPRSAGLRSLAGSLGLSGRAVFAGHAEDPLPYYRAMDVFVMSSVTEQTPNSLLEAMACGLPAVCTGVGDCGELLGETAEPAIVAPDDLAGYSRALRTLFESSRLRRELGERNRARCVTSFSLERMVDEYRQEYSKALGVRLEG